MGVQKKILTRDPSFYGAGTVTDPTGTEVAIQGGTGTLALGVPGNIFDASPARIHTAVLTDMYPVGVYVADEGIIVNPREYALRGTTETTGSGMPIGYNTLAPSLTLSAGMVASFMTFGHVVVYLHDVNQIFSGMDGSIIVGKPPEYNSSADYAVGDVVMYADEIYECKTAISGGEAWTAGHWNSLDYNSNNTDLCVLEVNGLK